MARRSSSCTPSSWLYSPAKADVRPACREDRFRAVCACAFATGPVAAGGSEMPSSWVPHNTVVGPRLQREIGSLFAAPEVADLLANRPFLINEPRNAWFVHSGAVDLFL